VFILLPLVMVRSRNGLARYAFKWLDIAQTKTKVLIAPASLVATVKPWSHCASCFLQRIQSTRGWDGVFFINPMHVGMDLDQQPKHLLVVGPFNFMHNAESAIVETITNAMRERGYEPHYY
jgi:hypothetical protein